MHLLIFLDFEVYSLEYCVIATIDLGGGLVSPALHAWLDHFYMPVDSIEQ